MAVNQISELTGRDRHGIPKRLENLPFTPGDKGAHLYESREALPLIYAVDNLEAARAAQARSKASLNAVREQDLRKQRIPIQIVRDVIDEVFQAMATTLKTEAARGAPLTTKRVNQFFEKFGSIPAKLSGNPSRPLKIVELEEIRQFGDGCQISTATADLVYL